MMQNRTALVLGGTGLTGLFLLKKLCNSCLYAKVISYSRSKPDFSHPKLVWKSENFNDLENLQPPAADDIFCCLGTTIKKAGSQKMFTYIDYEIPARVAELLENESRRFFLLTSIGANARSCNFYQKTKGKLEEKIKSLTYSSILILQPSLLLGARSEKRLWEDFAKKIDKLFQKINIPIVQKYNGIQAEWVAATFVKIAETDFRGVLTLDSLQIKNYINNNLLVK